jgi:hypothetical protein
MCPVQLLPTQSTIHRIYTTRTTANIYSTLKLPNRRPRARLNEDAARGSTMTAPCKQAACPATIHTPAGDRPDLHRLLLYLRADKDETRRGDEK